MQVGTVCILIGYKVSKYMYDLLRNYATCYAVQSTGQLLKAPAMCMFCIILGL